jgi:hypothetical protein
MRRVLLGSHEYLYQQRGCLSLKNIIIAGPSRAGKTTLAKKINEELEYFVINLDMLMTVFGRAYPQLDVRIAWDYDKATANVAPFIGHYLGTLTSNDKYADSLNLRKHDLTGNRFVLEGGHFDFDKISSILKRCSFMILKDCFPHQNYQTAGDGFITMTIYRSCV